MEQTVAQFIENLSPGTKVTNGSVTWTVKQSSEVDHNKYLVLTTDKNDRKLSWEDSYVSHRMLTVIWIPGLRVAPVMITVFKFAFTAKADSALFESQYYYKNEADFRASCGNLENCTKLPWTAQETEECGGRLAYFL